MSVTMADAREHWSDAAAKAARDLVPNKAFQSIAVAMATCKPFALDYLVQAPVLVLAASFGRTGHQVAERNLIRGKFAAQIAGRPRLRDLMKEYHVAYAFRTLKSTSVCPSFSETIFRVSQCSELHPSTLAQAIPTTPAAQAKFLRCVRAWCAQMDHKRMPPALAISWATKAAGVAAKSLAFGSGDLGDLADFYAADPAKFDLRWTLEQAVAAMRRWHDALAAEQEDKIAAAFQLRHGVPFDHRANYWPFESRCVRDGLEFHALDCGRALLQEGRAMHNCVITYAGDVLRGRSLIFSLRKEAKRVATLELGQYDRGFSIRQLKGPCNGPVSKSIYLCAQRFAEEASEQVRTSLRGAA